MKLNTRSKIVLSIVLAAVFTLSAAKAQQAATSEEQAFVNLMDGYLDLSRDVVELASTPETTVFLAIEGIVEIYEGRQEKGRSIEHLKSIMQSYPDNRVVRNLVRMKLKDIFVELGRTDEALQMLDAVIEENRS